MDAAFFETLLLTAKLAFLTTIILLLIGLPLANFLANTNFFGKFIIEALISMPLVLPPSVLGYYLLVAYSPNHWFGKFMESVFDTRLAFTFNGILIASVVFGLPFMIQPLQNGFKTLPTSLKEAAYTLGKSKLNTFFHVLLPNIKTSIITATALTFAHCIGEFGIVLMVGGSIPGETKVASIAIYDEVQMLNFEKADNYAIALVIISFLLLTLIYSINKKRESWKML